MRATVSVPMLGGCDNAHTIATCTSPPMCVCTIWSRQQHGSSAHPTILPRTGGRELQYDTMTVLIQYVRSLLSRSVHVRHFAGTRPACARHRKLTYSDGDAPLNWVITNFLTAPHDQAGHDFLRKLSWQGVVEELNSLAM
jgi:hypothetical protein